MPTYAEGIRTQQDFESERGLTQLNSIAFGLLRMQEELLEAQYEHLKGDLEKLLIEVLDVSIFAQSVLAKLCDELGVAPEQIDRMVSLKYASNRRKYDPAFFQGRMTSEAIKTARHWHNNGLGDQLGNDYY